MESLINILSGQWDYLLDKETGEPVNPPTGTVSLSRVDAEAFEKLCRHVRVEVEAEPLGGGGLLVKVDDLRRAIHAAPKGLDLGLETVAG